MLSESDRKKAHEQQKREKEFGSGYATCLHCNNQFPVSEGVVTSEAALCDVCNGN